MFGFAHHLLYAHRAASSAYMDGNPIISDDAFDILEKYLFPSGAPRSFLTVSKLHTRLVQHKHFVPSLSKLKTEEDIARWIKSLPQAGYTVSAKLDGVHVTLTYEAGKLIQAATRGKHTQGLSVLPHAAFFKGLPLAARAKAQRLSGTIEGELILPNPVFNKYKDTLFQNYTNPRAAVAGLLRADEPDGSLLGHCLFFAFEHYRDEPSAAYNHDACLRALVGYGFTIPYALQKTSKHITHKDLTAFILDAKRLLPYAVDGVVLRNNAVAPEDARIVGKYPHHARAFKLPAEYNAQETTVIKVSWQATRTGLYSPVVVVRPVIIDGVSIAHASGHNARYILDKGIGKGARVTIARRGDTIPGVVAVIKKAQPDLPPKPHVWNANRVHLLSNDPIARQCLALEFSFKTLGLKGVGPALAKKLVEAGYTSIASFKGKRSKHFARFGQGNAEILLRLTKALFETTWPRPLLMAASGIFPPGIGQERAAKVMADETYLKTSSNAEAKAIRENLARYMEFESNFKVDWSVTSPDRTLVFSGFRNDKVKAVLQTQGFGVSERITKTCALLVSSREDSLKVHQARKLGIPILLISSEAASKNDRLLAEISSMLRKGR